MGRKGFARRIPNPSDRRSVLVELDRRSVLVELDRQRVLASIAPLFAGWVPSLEELFAGYTDEQLETILPFLTEAARRQQQATADLTR